jgi:hypothetical protein
MTPVESSNVHSVGYNPRTETAYVRFHSNVLYSYSGVPVDEFEGLLHASSVGRYLNSNIKGTYPYHRW